MKQTYLVPNTVLMNLCGEFSQIVCGSGDEPSTPDNPTGGKFNFGGSSAPAPKRV